MNFKDIFQNKQKIKNIIKLVTKENTEVCEDLEQEVYIKAFKNKDKYNETGKFSNWITTITYNVSRDYLKSAKKRHETQFEDENNIINIKDKKISLEEKMLQKERQIRISGAINSLNKKMRDVIILSEIENLTYEEIAKRLNCPLGTVKSRIYNAKKELYNILEDLIEE